MDSPTHQIPHSTVSARSTESWKDNKRYLWLIGLVVPSLGFIAYGAWAATGLSIFFWIGPVIVLMVVPAIDLVTGLDRSNPPDDAIEALEEDKYYRWVTYAFLPLQFAAFLGAMYLIARGDPFGFQDDLSLFAKVGLAITIGVMGGIGINTAHELGHKREANERWLSKIALAQTFYGHFYIEHNRGHHVRVATPEDPASSRMGENLYQFLPRTVLGSLKSAWSIEKKRYARKGQHPFRLGNDVLNAWLMSVVLWGGVIIWLGLGIIPFLIIQASGFLLLEVVNYMEHYGMLRQKVGKPGKERYERVDPSHSWNSNNVATNVLLYHLQRHSDHHANPTRRYQTLRDFEESPVLPTGYAGMIVLALFPPLWSRVMDPRVAAHFEGDLTRANIMPRKREKMIAKYGVAVSAAPAEVAPTSVATPAAAPAATPGAEQANQTTATAQTDNLDDVMAARCPGCSYTYEVEVGNELEGFAAGTAWSDIPRDWCCPDCGVREAMDFTPLRAADAR